MLNMPFITDDKTEYKITFSYTYCDDPDDRGVWPRIERINESPSGAHHVEIMNDWNRGDLFNRACELAYLDMESKCVK